MTTPVTTATSPASLAPTQTAVAGPNGANSVAPASAAPGRSEPAHGQEQALPALSRSQLQDALLSLQLLQVRQFVADAEVPSLSDFAPQSTQANGLSAPSAGLAYDGGMTYDPQVEQLQRCLVAEGYMTQAEMDAGPGYYGPRTRAAVAELQRQNGILGNDGNNYGPQTHAALQNALSGSTTPSPQPGHSSGSTPSAPNADGSMRYWDVPNINQLNSEGSADDWNATSNCGPASMAMIARAFGYGQGMSDGTLINWLGSQIGITGDGTPGAYFDDMAKACGFGTEENWAPTTGWLEQQLREGKLVAINGDASVPSYSDSTPNTGFSGGHWIVVTGMDANGNFLVQDPSSDCKSLTPQEVQDFFARHDATNGSGVAVAVDSGRAPPSNTNPAPTPTPSPNPGNPGNPAPNVPAAGLAFDGGMHYNPQVQQLQQRLVETGYLSAADMATGPGYYGPRTRAAVAALQADYGISGNNGEDYGPRTQQALQQALAKSGSDPGVEAPAPVEGGPLSPQDAQTARRVDTLLQNYPNSRMQGMGETLVDACRDEGIPLDLVLAQLGKESTFLSDGVSVPNNNPGNLRFAQWESAFGGAPGQGGFAAFPDVASGIRAYVHLLASDTIPDASYPYSAMIANRDWNALVNAFAPASDGNDVAEYVQQLTDWCGYFADQVGIDENWIAQR